MLLPITGGSSGSLKFCGLQQSSLVSAEVETMLFTAVHAVLFASAETVCLEAHEQVSSLQLERDS